MKFTYYYVSYSILWIFSLYNLDLLPWNWLLWKLSSGFLLELKLDCGKKTKVHFTNIYIAYLYSYTVHGHTV